MHRRSPATTTSVVLTGARAARGMPPTSATDLEPHTASGGHVISTSEGVAAERADDMSPTFATHATRGETATSATDLETRRASSGHALSTSEVVERADDMSPTFATRAARTFAARAGEAAPAAPNFAAHRALLAPPTFPAHAARRAHLAVTPFALLAAFAACGAPTTPAAPTPAPAAPPPAAAPATSAAPAEPIAPAATPPLSADERAAAPGRIFHLAEREGGGATVDVILPSGQGAKTMLSGTPGSGPPSVLPGPVAPDGAYMAIITVDEQEDTHLERIEVRPLTPEGDLGEPVWRSEPAPQVRSPNWSPDGRSLAFEAAFSSFRDIYAIDLAEKTAPALRRLTDHPAGNYEPAYSPDGRQIAFVSSRDGNAEVYVMRADGSDPQRVTHFQLDDWGPVWSRDGGTLAFVSNREGSDRIFLSRPDGRELRRLTPVSPDIPKDFEPGEAEPTFTPDGLGLVYSVRTGPQRAALRRADLATGAITALTAGTSSDREPTFSPDGKLLVFASDRDGDPELYLMRPDGTGITRLTERPGPDWLPRWSPR